MLNRLLSLFLALIIVTGARAQGPSVSPTPAQTPPISVFPDHNAGAQNFVGPASPRPSSFVPFASLGYIGRSRVLSPEAFVNAVFPIVVDSSLTSYNLLAGADTCRFVRYDYDEWAKYHLLEPVQIGILNELAEKVYLSRYPYFWKKAALNKAVCVTRVQADSILSLNPPDGGNPPKHMIFSFSLPQFTDDGQYAVIDLNMVCGGRCGLGSTYIFHLTSTGWKMIGVYRNWSA